MSCDSIDLDIDKVSKAVAALRQYSESKSTNGKELLEEIVDVELQICLKKIPKEEKTIKLQLPHSIKKPDLEVCLFVKDLDKTDREYEATVHHFQDIFRKKGVTGVTEIIPLKSLKTEYMPFEAKRNLSNAFHIFLGDARIMRLLPSYLGKSFYGRKKAPVQVNLLAKNLSAEITAAISNSRCPVSTRGNSSAAVVAHLQMKDEEITENIIASASQISKKVPGGAVNIKMLNMKLKNSTSLPLYLSTGGPQDVAIPRTRKHEPVEAEEISTLFGAKVKVFPNGHIKIIKDAKEGEEPAKAQPKKKPAKSQAKKGPTKSTKGQKRRKGGAQEKSKVKKPRRK